MNDSIQVTTLIPIVISLLALLISAASFGYQHLYVRDQLICLVTKNGVYDNGSHIEVSIHVSLSNSGTRTMMLENGYLRLQHAARGTYYGEGGATNHELPLLIQKGEFRSVTFTQIVPHSNFSPLLMGKPTNADFRGPFEYYLFLRFVNVEGEYKKFTGKAVAVEIGKEKEAALRWTTWLTTPVKISYPRKLQDWDVT